MKVLDRRFSVVASLGLGAVMGLGGAALLDDTPSDTAAAVQAAPSYTITDLGTLGGQQASAYAINASGQIAGGANDAVGGAHAFLYDRGANLDLGALGPGAASNAVALNDLGVAVGWSTNPTDGRMHAVVFSYGRVTDLGVPSGFRSSSARGINSAGTVVGSSTGKGPGAYGDFTHAIRWANGIATDLGTLPGGRFANANGINDAGQIVGTSGTDNGSRGFVIAGGGMMTPLDPLPGGSLSWAFAINAAGHITGASTTATGSSEHAVLYVNGVVTDLGTVPGFRASTGLAINASDTVVGTAREPINHVHAALFKDGMAYDLNILIPADTGWELTSANGINDAGVIIGYGMKNGLQRAFALTLR